MGYGTMDDDEINTDKQLIRYGLGMQRKERKWVNIETADNE